WANLSGANLTGAYLTGADLTRAYLTGAYLTGAYLTGANLTWAYLGGIRIWQFGPVGSRGGWLVIKHGLSVRKWERDGRDSPMELLDEVMTGCFRGTLAGFEAAVQQTHGNNQWGIQYRGIIALAREWIKAAEPAPIAIEEAVKP
ncbi:MAG TPA: pentapeptide repeat-containing protein, partial [Dehalococcoidia bacterium]|nr:pentapeptide repeat-containing protein [Dehalococcoidia bacterium]